MVKALGVATLALLPFAACNRSVAMSPDGGTPDGAGTDGPNQGTFLTTLAVGAPTNASAAAFQDGDGAWVSLTGTSGVYPFTVTQAHYSVAVACTIGPGGRFTIVRATPAERPRPVVDCGPNSSLPTVSGSVTGFGNPFLGSAPIAVGPGTTVAAAGCGGPSAYSIPVGPGTYDLLAADHSMMAYDRMLIMRGLSVTSNLTVNLDFATGFTLVTSGHTLNVTGAVAGETVTTSIDLATASTMPISQALLSSLEDGVSIGGGFATFANYPMLPAGQSAPGDLYSAVGVAESQPGQPVQFVVRMALEFFTTPADLTLALPPPYSPTAVLVYPSGPGTPPVLVQTTLPAYAGAVAFSIHCGNWQAEITAGALGSPSYTVPDAKLIQMGPSAFLGQGFAPGPVLCSIRARSGDDPVAARRDGSRFAVATTELSVM